MEIFIFQQENQKLYARVVIEFADVETENMDERKEIRCSECCRLFKQKYKRQVTCSRKCGRIRRERLRNLKKNKMINETYRYKLSTGDTGTTNFSKKDFKDCLKTGVKLIKWEKENEI